MTLSRDGDDKRLLHDRVAEVVGIMRRRRGMSQEEVAYLAGIDVTTYRRVEARSREGRRGLSPWFDTVVKIVVALDVDHNELSTLFGVASHATERQYPAIAAPKRD